MLAAARALLTIPEAALTKAWSWKGGGEEEVRYGAYRAAEALEQAEVEARATVAATEAGERRAARIVGPATASRWDLHGILIPLDDALLDTDPGGGEWSIRLTLGHIISSQRAYGWGTAWWQTHEHDANDPALPKGVPDAFWATMPDEATTEARGDLDDLRARLDAILDLSAERLAGLPDDRLERGRSVVGFSRDGRLPSGPLGLAHPRARDPDREDVRDDRSRSERAGTTRPQHARVLRPCRVGRVRSAGRRPGGRSDRRRSRRSSSGDRVCAGSLGLGGRLRSICRDDHARGRRLRVDQLEPGVGIAVLEQAASSAEHERMDQ